MIMSLTEWLLAHLDLQKLPMAVYLFARSQLFDLDEKEKSRPIISDRIPKRRLDLTDSIIQPHDDTYTFPLH